MAEYDPLPFDKTGRYSGEKSSEKETSRSTAYDGDDVEKPSPKHTSSPTTVNRGNEKRVYVRKKAQRRKPALKRKRSMARRRYVVDACSIKRLDIYLTVSCMTSNKAKPAPVPTKENSLGGNQKSPTAAALSVEDPEGEAPPTAGVKPTSNRPFGPPQLPESESQPRRRATCSLFAFETVGTKSCADFKEVIIELSEWAYQCHERWEREGYPTLRMLRES
ncbi:MAG: hypothetical protein Q9211_002406 [Gyalolechia sp. 1 TL-2023]